MEKSSQIDSDVNYDWNFLNYPIHTVSAKPENTSKECAILLIHGFGASTDHWRFNIPILSSKYEVHAMDLLGFGKSPKPQDCLLYTSPSPRDLGKSRMPSSA